MLTGIAALITAIAGLITAATGLIGMFVLARRISPKERVDAAEHATRNALNPPTPGAEVQALVEIHEARRGRRRRRAR